MPNRGKHAFDRIARSQMAPVLGREVVESQKVVAVPEEAGDRVRYFVPYFSTRTSIAAAARFGAIEMSRRSAFMLCCTEVATLLSTLIVLCCQHRCRRVPGKEGVRNDV